MSFDIPETKIKIGDKLRLRMDQAVRLSAGAGATWAIGHDPKDRNDSATLIEDADSTMLNLHIPFKIDT